MLKKDEKFGFYIEYIEDDYGRVVEENYPVDENGNWLEGYDTEWTTFEYCYEKAVDEETGENLDYTICYERHRGWTAGCFWTDWREC